MKVWIVCESPHGHDDSIHEIVDVYASEETAEKAAQPDYTFHVEVFEVRGADA